MLLNGQRISGFRELRDLPPEAIQRMEILPEEVALKYGYTADQRVVNIVLRPRFNSTSAELRGSAATEGGYAGGFADGTRLTIRDGKRTSINVRIDGNNPLYEAERDIAPNSESSVDERSARTLVSAAQSARVTGVHNRPVGEGGALTVTGEAARSHGRSRFGLADFDTSDVLTRDTDTTSLGLGTIYNATRGNWRLSVSGNGEYERSESDSERSVVTALTDDKSNSTRTNLVLDATANGPLFKLAAGEATATFKSGLSRLDFDSESRRRDIFTQADLGRTIGEGSANVDLPLAATDSAIGRLSANANLRFAELSDFGTLTSFGGGLAWSPTTRLNVITSFTREEGAPTLQELGNPLVETDDVPYFDAVRGETVEVTTLTGGNPALDSDRRSVWKLGANWQVLQEPDLRLRAEYVSQTIDNPQVGFPAATPALEAAFPERFKRDAAFNLVAVDTRPVNGDRSQRDTIRWGLNFSKSLKSATPTREQIEALRQRFGASVRTRSAGDTRQDAGEAEAPQGTAPSPSQAPRPAVGERTPNAEGGPPREGGEFRGGGRGGRGGGYFGGRNGGRLTFSLNHTIALKDELQIASGLPKLNYLDGEAVSSTGGRPRHVVESESGYYNNGLGVRLMADWRSATRVDSLTGPDLKFDQYATFDLRLFANLGERFDLVARNPFLFGSSVRFEVKNIFNARPQVRNRDGVVPFAYQEDLLEPIGRTVSISFRKLFLPRRFQRPPGRAR
ncbi:TonB-dependent receptor [Sphingomonas sp. HDW15A]|uniref:TonB-dependent receptor n=1 Tax=Sphingomonas sp. HDW15A TaxID=2714942 RepID=UPI00140DBAC7|nr:TonB-dependent receptor [Sphingomonas sp. HDW15A]QIK97052.1 TonB-dependent receptor [Sphingomonas sp. HDW15A]